MKYLTLALFTSFIFNLAASEKSCFAVEGMTCGSCKEKIETLLIKKAGIQTAEVALKQEIASISYDAKITNDNLIVRYIQEAGYKGKKVECSE